MMNCGLHKVEGLVYDNGCELSFIKKMPQPVSNNILKKVYNCWTVRN